MAGQAVCCVRYVSAEIVDMMARTIASTALTAVSLLFMWGLVLAPLWR